MAYKFFSQELVNKGNLDFSNVFPEKQSEAKQQNNVAYGLGDILIYLQDVTDNFKRADQKYVDLDNGIREVVEKYYKSIGQPNPYEVEEVIQVNKFQKGVVPREAGIVEDGSVKNKMPRKYKAVEEAAAAMVAAPPMAAAPMVSAPVGTPEEILIQRIESLKADLNRKKRFLKLADDDEKREFMESFMRKLIYQEEDAIEELENAKNENRQPNPFLIEKVKILKDFANVNK